MPNKLNIMFCLRWNCFTCCLLFCFLAENINSGKFSANLGFSFEKESVALQGPTRLITHRSHYKSKSFLLSPQIDGKFAAVEQS